MTATRATDPERLPVEELERALAKVNREGMMDAPETVEVVARAICWDAVGKDNDCSDACMAATACRGVINGCFLRDAKAAIAALKEIACGK